MTFPQYEFDRRQFLRVGAAGVVGVGLPAIQRMATAAASGTASAKSVLIVWLSGGPSQLDMLDPKPAAPAEIRGDFASIETTIPGVAVGEHLPKLAQQMRRWSVVRSLHHLEHNHLLATHVGLTGRPTPIPRGGSDLDRKSTRLNSSHIQKSRMPSSA